MSETIRMRTSVVCVDNNRVLVFKAVDPTNHKQYLFLPGGKIEENETAEQAALRETMEETGYEVELIEGWTAFEKYLFEWDDAIHNCATYFYIARLKDSTAMPYQVDDVEYNKGVCWISIHECEHAFSYHPAIQKAVMQALRHAGVCK